MSAYLPVLGAALRHGPLLAAGAMLAVSPAGFALVAATFERRLMRIRGEFTALVFGDPLLAVAVAAGAWLLRGRALPAPAGAPYGVAWMTVMFVFGLVQWRGELRAGFYTRAQALSPTKIWHQLAVYPLLGYWMWTAGLGGLLVPGELAARATILVCVLAWLAANIYDRLHPKLGHPPYDWRRLRPCRQPWPPQSVSLRAYLSVNGEVSPGTGTAATATLNTEPRTGLLPARQPVRSGTMRTSSPHTKARTFMHNRAPAKAGLAALAAAVAFALTAAVSGPTALAAPNAVLTRAAGDLQHGTEFTKDGNWAGYVVHSGQHINQVSGEWTIPELNCQQTPNSLAAVWAGIGGMPRQLLLQTGVSDSCKGGVEQEWAWWEMAPTYNPVTFSLIVRAGDQMQASVYRDQAGQWVTRIDNLTTGWSGWMIAGQTYGVGRDGAGSFTNAGSARDVIFFGSTTADWIVEGPGLIETGSNFLPISDFGTVRFYGLRAGLSRWSLTASEGDEISYHNRLMAVPALPGSDGFSVSYTG